ncbi:MAG: hypothetical protein DDT40_00790 [candidate division WS2 bacterium]|nr:hypothetical protein [Candidatus Psychracetigena formicireducens]
MRKYKVSELISALKNYRIDIGCLLRRLLEFEEEYITDSMLLIFIESCLSEKVVQ